MKKGYVCKGNTKFLKYGRIQGIPGGIMGVYYNNWIMDLLSKDNAKLKNENEQLKKMIQKFNSGEYYKEKLIQEYYLLIKKRG